jgi:integrase
MLPINKGLEDILRQIVRHDNSPYVFCKTDGTKYGNIRKTYIKVCNRVGVSDFHFHDLRHTYASQLVMANINLTTVSRLMGHKSLAMTLRYSHLAPDIFDSAASILNERLNITTSQLLHI